MNYKSKLQEWCQKYKYTLPQYSTQRVGGTDNEPKWLSKIHLNNYLVQGLIYKTKVEAEQSAAQKLICILETQPKYQSPESGKGYILIDLENMAQVKDWALPLDWINIGVMSNNGNLDLELLESKMVIKIIPSTARDVSDHYLTFIAAQIPKSYQNKPILIVTKDHYGTCLVDILSLEGFEKVQQIVSLDQLKKYL